MDQSIKKIIFTVWLMGGGGKMNLNQNCKKFHEMDESIKKLFSLFGWWWGGGVVKMNLNQNCKKFHEMDKSI